MHRDDPRTPAERHLRPMSETTRFAPLGGAKRAEIVTLIQGLGLTRPSVLSSKPSRRWR